MALFGEVKEPSEGAVLLRNYVTGAGFGVSSLTPLLVHALLPACMQLRYDLPALMACPQASSHHGHLTLDSYQFK